MIFLFFCFGMLIEKNLLIRVPGQRRLAISRSRVPNLDGFVIAAAGNLFSIGTPHHRVDPEIVRSQDTNQQKQRGENLRGKTLGKKNVPARVPGDVDTRISRSTDEKKKKKTYIFECSVSVDHRRHAKRMFLNLLHFYFSRTYSSQKIYLFEWLFTPGTLRQEHD